MSYSVCTWLTAGTCPSVFEEVFVLLGVVAISAHSCFLGWNAPLSVSEPRVWSFCAGFKGVHCELEVNECQSNPCVNNGQCVDKVNRFQCLCPPGKCLPPAPLFFQSTKPADHRKGERGNVCGLCMRKSLEVSTWGETLCVLRWGTVLASMSSKSFVARSPSLFLNDP